MRFALYLLSFIVLVSSVCAGELLRVDFEKNAVGNYSDAAAKADFRQSTASGQWFDGFEDGRAAIAADPNQGKVLRLTYPAGCYGTVDPHACAAQVKVYLSETAHDTLWLSFKVRFDSDFDFVKGGKLPGLCGSQCKTGGNIPSGDDGWSARHMWRTGGAAVQYLYFFGQPSTYGLDVPFDIGGTQRVFTPGQWTTIVQQVALNTMSSEGAVANGKVCSWFDGEKAACDSGYVFRTQDTMHIDKFYLSTFHGGDGTDWAPTVDVFAEFDDFVVSTEPLIDETPAAIRVPRGASIPTRPLQGNVTNKQIRYTNDELRWYRSDGRQLQ